MQVKMNFSSTTFVISAPICTAVTTTTNKLILWLFSRTRRVSQHQNSRSGFSHGSRGGTVHHADPVLNPLSSCQQTILQEWHTKVE